MSTSEANATDWYEVDEVQRLSNQNAQLQAEVARLRGEMLRAASSASDAAEAEASGSGTAPGHGPGA